MESVKLLQTLELFFGIISKSKLDEVSYQVLKAIESEFITGSKIEDFYNPKPEDVKSKNLKTVLKNNSIDLKGVPLKDIKSKLEGKVIRASAKFPTDTTTSYGLLRTSIHFKNNSIIYGRDVWNYTAGDPNLWPRMQGGF